MRRRRRLPRVVYLLLIYVIAGALIVASGIFGRQARKTRAVAVPPGLDS